MESQSYTLACHGQTFRLIEKEKKKKKLYKYKNIFTSNGVSAERDKRETIKETGISAKWVGLSTSQSSL